MASLFKRFRRTQEAPGVNPVTYLIEDKEKEQSYGAIRISTVAENKKKSCEEEMLQAMSEALVIYEQETSFYFADINSGPAWGKRTTSYLFRNFSNLNCLFIKPRDLSQWQPACLLELLSKSKVEVFAIFSIYFKYPKYFFPLMKAKFEKNNKTIDWFKCSFTERMFKKKELKKNLFVLCDILKEGLIRGRVVIAKDSDDPKREIKTEIAKAAVGSHAFRNNKTVLNLGSDFIHPMIPIEDLKISPFQAFHAGHYRLKLKRRARKKEQSQKHKFENN